ncbi:MAG TPA: T9SS type A sorting domain-containing protein [Chitinophagaceae bacterium]|nr:T9SS type A sorting domain-containing protein [Chitinophagaceae bacterium]
MKSIFLVLLQLLLVHTISAQLTITPGAQFAINGNVQLAIENVDFINNGNFIGNGIISFTGNAISKISGSQPIQFSEIEISKTNNSSVLLQRPIGVSQRIHLSSGFLNLNSFNADLGTTGHLDGEREDARIIGPNGGEVLFNVSLNSPTGSNPANLGVFITSNQNLGNVIIKRGHQSQINNQRAGNSVFRYYDILPANNTNLNATLRFKYFDGELNNLDENSLIFFESTDAINWTNLGFTSRDVVEKFVEKTGINSFERFTLFNDNNPLPVHFILFNAKCEGDKVLLTWKTAQEQNSSHFNIERSVDGISWTVINSLPAAGNSNTEHSYSFTDNNPVQNSFYRIAEYDLNGRVQYSSILRSSCNTTDIFKLWPNPVRDVVFINIVTGSESKAVIKVFDSRGALVKEQRATVLQGSNQLSIDMRSMAKGVYSLTAYWNNGQTKQTVQVLKQ